MRSGTTPAPTLQEIREAHSWKRDYERYLFLSRYLFRPLGFLVTWVAIRLGLTSEGVSWLSGLVGLAGCGLLVSGWQQVLPAGIGLLLLFNLLDCVDGSIARTMKTENPYGRFLDSVCGGVIDLVFCAVVGILAFQHPNLLHWPNPFEYGPIFWLAVGGMTCFMCQTLGLLEQSFDGLLKPSWNKGQGLQAKQVGSNDGVQEELSVRPNNQQSTWPLRLIVATNLRVRETHYVLLVAAYLASIVDVLLSVYLVYYLVYSLLLLVVYSKRGQQIRRSYLVAK
jgi:hypothetical protein